MPIYDYVCRHCGNQVEDEMAKPGQSIQCKICQEDMEQLMPEIQFKIGNVMATQHKRKYGNNHHAAPKAKGNGVKFYGKKKSKE